MKAQRHIRILEIIRDFPVTTQEELQTHLQASGFAVTQATVSRDIRDLHLIKTTDAQGRYRYAAVRQDSDPMAGRFHTMFGETILGVDCAMNLVVVKCYSGMAQAACAAIDSQGWQQVVGTLAGEDTFLCITKTPETAEQLADRLKKLVGLA